MSEAVVAQKGFFVLELEPGTYFWCRCARSKSQTFCDGSDKMTDLTPVKLELETQKKVAFCGCKRTGNQSFCAGTHNSL